MSESRTLLVFAHRDEATAFADVPHLVTGVGKVNAAVSLAAALAGVETSAGAGTSAGAEAPAFDRVVVLGTAGVVGEGADRLSLEEVYQIRGVVQHDFSLPSPELIPAGELMLPVEQTAVIATGDVFVKNDAQREAIAALGAALVDMEAYAFAAVCARYDVPLHIFKIPSDFADSSTTDAEWDEIVFRKSEQLREFWNTRLA